MTVAEMLIPNGLSISRHILRVLRMYARENKLLEIFNYQQLDGRIQLLVPAIINGSITTCALTPTCTAAFARLPPFIISDSILCDFCTRGQFLFVGIWFFIKVDLATSRTVLVEKGWNYLFRFQENLNEIWCDFRITIVEEGSSDSRISDASSTT
jgi:hypothetical protein